jgi:hypothetical protein
MSPRPTRNAIDTVTSALASLQPKWLPNYSLNQLGLAAGQLAPPSWIERKEALNGPVIKLSVEAAPAKCAVV